MTIGFRSDSSRSIVMLDGVDRVAFNEDGSLELLTPAANPTGNKVMTVSQMPFSKVYNSPEQAITLGTVTSLTHNLGSRPKIVTLSAICKTAELGYAVGDEIDVGLAANNNSGGASIGSNSTTLRMIAGASGIYCHNASGAVAFITPANWRLVVRAWA